MSLNNIEITKETLIRSKVHEMILDGELQPGDKLPSENELSDAYDAKRIEAEMPWCSLRKWGLYTVNKASAVSSMNPFRRLDLSLQEQRVSLTKCRSRIFRMKAV